MVKTLLAALLSAALIWAIPIQATPVNNSEIRIAVTKSAQATTMKNSEPKADKEEVAPVDKPAPQESETQPEQATVVTPEPVVAETPQETPIYTDDAKAFIYQHESGNNPTAENAGGCYGLGQDCNGIVKSQCGASYSCQDDFFTNYMLRRYGTWQAAKSFWLGNCGSSSGCWW